LPCATADLAEFSAACDIPIPWITEFFDVVPFDQLSSLVAIEILESEPNGAGFLRKARHLFMGMPTPS